MHTRNKTQRKRVVPSVPTLTPGVAGGIGFAEEDVARATETGLDALFAAETTATFQQTWQKLDRGSRLDRLRKYVQSYPDLTPAERASLLTAVLQAFELRQLNTKAAVEYDPVSASVISVRGLRERTNVAGLKTFRIDAAPATARTTQRAKKVTPVAEASGST
jgi:hypothetical protein